MSKARLGSIQMAMGQQMGESGERKGLIADDIGKGRDRAASEPGRPRAEDQGDAGSCARLTSDEPFDPGRRKARSAGRLRSSSACWVRTQSIQVKKLRSDSASCATLVIASAASFGVRKTDPRGHVSEGTAHAICPNGKTATEESRRSAWAGCQLWRRSSIERKSRQTFELE